jgi:starch synthase
MDVRIILPLYEEVASKFKNERELVESTFVYLNWRKQYCGIFTAKVGNVT